MFGQTVLQSLKSVCAMCLVLSKLWMVGRSVQEPRSNLLLYYVVFVCSCYISLLHFFYMQGRETKIFKIIFRGDESDQSSCAQFET